MKIEHKKLHFTQNGKGFITNNTDGLIGRTLTQTFIDQNKKIYIKINDEIIPLTEHHNFLAVD